MLVGLKADHTHLLMQELTPGGGGCGRGWEENGEGEVGRGEQKNQRENEIAKEVGSKQS